MTSWFRRAQQAVAPVTPAPGQPAEDEDTPTSLLQAVYAQIAFVNENAGRLPNEAVVVARRVTDTLREIIDTSAERALDVRAVVMVKSMATDYLPTTLRTYLALDPSLVQAARRDGRTPGDLLLEQLAALWGAADDLLSATRARDVDALSTQGNFLRTKFTRSDLDL